MRQCKGNMAMLYDDILQENAVLISHTIRERHVHMLIRKTAMKKIISILLIAVILILPLGALDGAGLKPGQIGGDWTVLLLSRAGELSRSDADDYCRAALELVKSSEGVLHKTRSTEYSRLILALASVGRDPRRLGGFDLVKPLTDPEFVKMQGISGPIWALIALDSLDAESEVRDGLLSFILSQQTASGSFTEAVDNEVDLTAMALTALAKHPEASDAVEAGFGFLASRVNKNGGFDSRWGESSETVSQVLIALAANGMSGDKRFAGLYENLLSYRVESHSKDGGFTVNDRFAHTRGGKYDRMATEQALLALIALSRAAEGKCSVYDFSDVEPIKDELSSEQGLPGKSNAVKVPGSSLSVDLDDLTAECRSAVKELASRGIVNGYGDGSFRPSSSLSRAEFCALIVRALGLESRSAAPRRFTDVPEGEWYAKPIAVASEFSLINGIGGGLFDPNGTITREQAAVICARAAKLCGHDTARSASEIRNALSPFSDYTRSSSYAREALAFCVDIGILDPAALSLRPLENVTRGEMAVMLYKLLSASKLI